MRLLNKERIVTRQASQLDEYRYLLPTPICDVYVYAKYRKISLMSELLFCQMRSMSITNPSLHLPTHRSYVSTTYCGLIDLECCGCISMPRLLFHLCIQCFITDEKQGLIHIVFSNALISNGRATIVTITPSYRRFQTKSI